MKRSLPPFLSLLLLAAIGVAWLAPRAPERVTAQVDVPEHCHEVLGGVTGPPEVCPTTTNPTTSTVAPSTSTSTTVAPPTTDPPTTAAPTTAAPTSPPPTTAAPPPGVAFSADFAQPSGFYDQFDTYTGNYCTNGTSCRPENIADSIKEFPGSHNMACEPPPTNRTVQIHDHDNLFWWCAPGADPAKGHVMTGLNTSGYALVSFSPRRSFIDVTEVCWDVSLADLGGGKWFNVVLVPEAIYRSHPNTNPRRAEDGEGPYRLDYVTPGFTSNGEVGDFNIQDIEGVIGVKQFRGNLSFYDGPSFFAGWGDTFTTGSQQSNRYRHCFRDNGNGTVTIEQDRAGTLYRRTAQGAFPDGEVRVIFQDDTYDADKHGGTGLYTWHWDNITIR